MYTAKELKAAAGIIKKIAHENNVSEAEVRADMKMAMDCGRYNPAPSVRAQWANFQYAGAEPTLEEFILWTVSMMKKQ